MSFSFTGCYATPKITVVSRKGVAPVQWTVDEREPRLDIYHVWCNLKQGVGDTEFSDAAKAYFEHLKSENRLSGYRITRRKLGLGPEHLPEFHIMLEFDGLAQLDRAFGSVAARRDPVESFHHSVNSRVQDAIFALYRDFPDEQRVRGEEKF